MRAICFRCVGVRISSNNRPQAHLLDSPGRVLRCVAIVYITAALCRAVLIVDIVLITG